MRAFSLALAAGPVVGDPAFAIGNGYVGLWSNGTGVEHVAGVFRADGTLGSGIFQMSRAPIPSWTSTAHVSTINGTTPTPSTTLDVRSGAAVTTTGAGAVTCTQHTYAHRDRRHVVATDINCTNTGVGAVEVVVLQADCPALSTLCNTTTHGLLWTRGAAPVPGVECKRIDILQAETEAVVKPVVGECHSVVPATGLKLTVPPAALATRLAGGGSAGVAHVRLISTRVTNLDQPPIQGDIVELAQLEWIGATASSTLFADHVYAMDDLNTAGIEVAGDPAWSQLVNVSWYTLLASFRDDSPYSSSSQGLAASADHGHVTAGTERWVLPTLTAFQPLVARAALQYRVDRSGAAAGNAAGAVPRDPTPRSGLRFPLQSASTGNEQAAAGATDYDQGEIARAFAQHWAATGDTTWLQDQGFPLLDGVASYFASRVSGTGPYHLNHSEAPDAPGPADDPTYANAVASLALRAAYDLATAAGQKSNGTYKVIADGLVIPLDEQTHRHPPCPGCHPTSVPAAGAVQLAHPLGMAMDPTVRDNDLNYYSAVTSPTAPPSTWLAIAEAHTRAGNATAAEAARARALEAGVGADLESAGALLSLMWSGYGGVSFHTNGTMTVAPQLPAGIDSLVLRQLQFLSNRLILRVDAKGWTLELAPFSPPEAQDLVVVSMAGASALRAGPVSVPAGQAALVQPQHAVWGLVV
mmetsp:Transcript_56940/g.131001  ORF Transcript_56940/g.131001 Transcript_56940/m.131001 type:complete len:697 (-) Transcript_56940:198-2288(-)